MENQSKIPIGNKKRVFSQTSINDQKPKLREHINDIIIVCLLDTDVDVSLLKNLGLQIGLFKRQMFNY